MALKHTHTLRCKLLGSNLRTQNDIEGAYRPFIIGLVKARLAAIFGLPIRPPRPRRNLILSMHF